MHSYDRGKGDEGDKKHSRNSCEQEAMGSIPRRASICKPVIIKKYMNSYKTKKLKALMRKKPEGVDVLDLSTSIIM